MGIIDILMIECIGEILLNFTPYRHRFLLRGTCKRLRVTRSVEQILNESFLYLVESQQLHVSLRNGIRIASRVVREPSYIFHRWFKDHIRPFISHVSRSVKTILSDADYDQAIISCRIRFFVLTNYGEYMLNFNEYRGYNDIEYEYKFKLDIDSRELESLIEVSDTIMLDRPVFNTPQGRDEFFGNYPHHLIFPRLITNS